MIIVTPEIKLIEIVHADHLSDRDVPRAPLWNNYYEYALTHFRAEVTHIVSCDRIAETRSTDRFFQTNPKNCDDPRGGFEI